MVSDASVHKGMKELRIALNQIRNDLKNQASPEGRAQIQSHVDQCLRLCEALGRNLNA